MSVVKSYGNLTRKLINNPDTTLKLIKLGALLQYTRWSKFPDKKIPKSLQYLNELMFKYLLEPLKNPEQSAFVNLFAPCEILQSFNIYPMFVEAEATFLSGLNCEDIFIDAAENCGISETLCSYHKSFIGAVEKGVLPKLKFSVTSSMICDANISTFRYISKKYDIPHFVIDVPYEYSIDAEEYVKDQLIEMTEMVEDITKQKFHIDKLKEIICRENRIKEYMNSYLESLSSKYFPNHMTLEMSKLMLSHCGIGREETFRFYKMISEEIKAYPDRSCTSILWVHTIPFYDETLKNYFNYNEKYNFIGIDLNYDNLQSMNIDKPFNSIAKKMLTNIYNGSFERKVDAILNIIEKTRPDGVINLCHWGCKQSSGGSNILKEALKSRNIPYLSIDGDGVDRRNTPSGQIKTRLEAFLEILDSRRKVN